MAFITVAEGFVDTILLKTLNLETGYVKDIHPRQIHVTHMDSEVRQACAYKIISLRDAKIIEERGTVISLLLPTFTVSRSFSGLPDPNHILIGLTGKQGSGKTTLTKRICSLHDYEEMKLSVFSFATPLKHICMILFGLTPDQINGPEKDQIDPQYNATPRYLLQKVGTDFFRAHFPRELGGRDVWVQNMRHRITKERERHPQTYIIVDDVRFENEAALIREMGGCVIRLFRHKPEDETHVSETEMDAIEPDAFVYNTLNGDISLISKSISHFIKKNKVPRDLWPLCYFQND